MANPVPVTYSADEDEKCAGGRFVTPVAFQHNLDTENVSPGTVAISIASQFSPELAWTPRRYEVNYVHTLARISGMRGRRPVFTLDTSSRNLATAMSPSWRPCYSYDLVTWTHASAVNLLTAPNRAQWQFDEAFSSRNVWVADHPIFTYSNAVALADDLLGDTSGLVHVSALANASGVIGTSPPETNNVGFSCGSNSIFGFRLEDESATTTDGLPRREIVITCGVHAGEVLDGWYLRGIIDWFLEGSDADASYARRNFRVLAYFLLNPNGRFGGGPRGNFRVSEDPNRDWGGAGAFGITENAIVRDAVLSDSTTHTVHIDLHSGASSSLVSRIYYLSDIAFSTYQAFKSKVDALDADTLSMAPSTADNTIGKWAISRGAKLVVISEPGTARGAPRERLEQLGAIYARAVVQMEAEGVLA